MMTKTCPRCQTAKPLDEFYRETAKPDGHSCYCKPCAKAQACAWNTANREVRNDRRRARLLERALNRMRTR